MTELFPNGVQSYLVGGALIGLGAGLVHLCCGGVGGVSSILSAAHALWSRAPFFRTPALRSEWSWKSRYVLGIVLGAGAWALFAGGPYVTTVQPWRLALGGLFVGLGTRAARGCTSGHGICGLASGARPSLVATAVFVLVAIGVAGLMHAAGVRP